jgi:hypothetical protein
MEGMEIRDDFFQFTQANRMHSTLQAIAKETDTSPSGREAISTAGLKTKATSKNAMVVVYPVPVDFSDANMQPPRLSETALHYYESRPKMNRIRSLDLVQASRGWAEVLRRSLLSVKLQ